MTDKQKSKKTNKQCNVHFVPDDADCNSLPLPLSAVTEMFFPDVVPLLSKSPGCSSPLRLARSSL